MRNLTVDIAKGIAGVLVIAGHSIAFRYTEGWLLQCSHLGTPLFIFLSGVFINIDRPWRESVIRKADRLLKPYFVVLLAMGIMYAVAGKLDPFSYLVGVFYATGPTIPLVPLWFLPHLCLCLLTGIAVLQLCRRLKFSRYAYVLFLLLLLFAGQQCLEFVWQKPLDALWWQSMLRPALHWPGLPWSLDVLPITLTFLLAGHVCSPYVKKISFQWLPLLISALVFLLFIRDGNAAIDINRRVYSSYFFTSTLVFFSIYLLLSFSSILSNSSLLANVFSYIGKNFLIILLLHMIILRMLFIQAEKWMPEWYAWHVPLVFLAGLLLSVLLVALVQRSRLLSLLLLPVKSSGVSH